MLLQSIESLLTCLLLLTAPILVKIKSNIKTKGAASNNHESTKILLNGKRESASIMELVLYIFLVNRKLTSMSVIAEYLSFKHYLKINYKI
jgi:hypothetical protein